MKNVTKYKKINECKNNMIQDQYINNVTKVQKMLLEYEKNIIEIQRMRLRYE